MACVIDPLVNGFSVLLDACQRLMQKHIYAEGVCLYKRVTNEMQHLLSSLYFTVVFLYMFREHFAPIIRSSKNCMYNHWYKS
jgi:hypothetical protein